MLLPAEIAAKSQRPLLAHAQMRHRFLRSCRVTLASPTVRILHLPHRLLQRTQLTRMAVHPAGLTSPLRPPLGRYQPVAGIRPQRIEDHLLTPPVWLRVRASGARAAPAVVHAQQVRIPLAGAAFVRAHEGLGEFHGVSPLLLPVGTEALDIAAEHVGGEVRKGPGSPRTRKRVLLPIKCRRLERTALCQPIQRSRVRTCALHATRATQEGSTTTNGTVGAGQKGS